MLKIQIEENEFHLLAQRGLYWPDERTLFVTDTHLGKSATFQRNSMAIPGSTTHGTLSTISKMLDATGATSLVILGDLFHARSSLAAEVVGAFEEFLEQHARVQFTLVRGNHDLRVGELPSRWSIEIVDPGARKSALALGHEPTEKPSDCQILLCGHLHPAVRIREGRQLVGKFPCFWLNDGRLVLPAVGEFTGTMVIHPGPSDRIWALVMGEVIELPQFGAAAQ